MATCSHLEQVREVTPSAPGCEECLQMGDSWVHLRLCLICGHVGCCDSSKNKHATQHFHITSHPLMQSFQPGEDWGWCYVDEVMIAGIPKVTAPPAQPLLGYDEAVDESFPASDTPAHGEEQERA
jgi:hypothetical protein